MKTRTRIVFAVSAGLSFALTAHFNALWVLGFVGLACWSLALEETAARRAAWVSWLVGVAATLALWHWLPRTVVQFTGLPLAAGFVAWVLFCALSSVPFALAGLVSSWARPTLGHPIALAASAWLMEAWGPHIFPWQPAASIINMPWLPMSASLLGVSGLGAVLMVVCAVAARALVRRVRPSAALAWGLPDSTRGHLVGALAALVLLLAYGAFDTYSVRAARATAGRVHVALVQPGVPPLMRWDPQASAAIHARLHQLTERAEQRRPALVVWPEGSFPYPLPFARSMDGAFSPYIHPPTGTASPLLFGALALNDDTGRAYNGAFIREPDGTVGPPVAKRVLVPFGEHVPVIGELPFVRRILVRAYGLWPGTTRTELRTKSGLRLGVLNCFEDMIPVLAAELADADFLVNITNDSWFGDGLGPREHLMLSRWRAIETHRDLVRAVTRGVTSHVNALGEVEAHLVHAEADVLHTTPARLHGWTLARAVIPAGPWAMSALLLGAVGLRVLRARRAPKVKPSEEKSGEKSEEKSEEKSDPASA